MVPIGPHAPGVREPIAQDFQIACGGNILYQVADIRGMRNNDIATPLFECESPRLLQTRPLQGWSSPSRCCIQNCWGLKLKTIWARKDLFKSCVQRSPPQCNRNPGSCARAPSAGVTFAEEDPLATRIGGANWCARTTFPKPVLHSFMAAKLVGMQTLS